MWGLGIEALNSIKELNIDSEEKMGINNLGQDEINNLNQEYEQEGEEGEEEYQGGEEEYQGEEENVIISSISLYSLQD